MLNIAVGSKKYQQKLYFLVRRMVIEHEDADDIMQNVWIKIWRNLAGFKQESQLYTWLYRIACNETFSFLQQKKKQAKMKKKKIFLISF